MGFPRTLMLAALALSAVAAPGVATTASAQTPPTDTSIKPASTAYRYRVLGVFDDVTGDPLEGVEVSDILTGNKSLTTSTGTVSLLFLPDGGGFIRLRKVGYELQTMPVAIAPSELTPVTVVLRRATMLEKVVVTDSAAHHVSPGLRQFEEHRRNGTVSTSPRPTCENRIPSRSRRCSRASSTVFRAWPAEPARRISYRRESSAVVRRCVSALVPTATSPCTSTAYACSTTPWVAACFRTSHA
jgi:hypothetical protein